MLHFFHELREKSHGSVKRDGGVALEIATEARKETHSTNIVFVIQICYD